MRNLRQETQQRIRVHRSWRNDREETYRPTTGPVTRFSDLTCRQQEILQRIAQGDTNAAIARALAISQGTVNNHCTGLFARLPLRRDGDQRVLAVVWYFQQGER